MSDGLSFIDDRRARDCARRVAQGHDAAEATSARSATRARLASGADRLARRLKATNDVIARAAEGDAIPIAEARTCHRLNEDVLRASGRGR